MVVAVICYYDGCGYMVVAARYMVVAVIWHYGGCGYMAVSVYGGGCGYMVVAVIWYLPCMHYVVGCGYMKVTQTHSLTIIQTRTSLLFHDLL
jgi:hypothetical protein